jgi:1,4-dihydroxy-6-naphthoate synthase
MNRISLGFSSCPNDTFIFDAMVHHKIDTEGLEFDCTIADVEALNRMALSQELDVTKLSFHAFVKLTEQYLLLRSGSALGRKCGPLLIAREHCSPEQLIGRAVAIPGGLTTANLLLTLLFPGIKDKTEMIFSGIEDAVSDGRFDAGLIIHESRFTFQEKGLVMVADLGDLWEEITGLPIPLGGIAVRRGLPAVIIDKMARIMRRSVEYAFLHPDSGAEYVAGLAQVKRPEVISQHIELYVNDFTLDLGTEGEQAVQALIGKSLGLGLISRPPKETLIYP